MAFVGLVAATEAPPIAEESLATFAEPEPIATEAPTEPPATPLPAPTAVADAQGMASRSNIDPGDAEAGVANTDADGLQAEPAGTPVVDEYYVPDFVAAEDRTMYEADVSAPLETTPEPEEPPAPAPTEAPHVHPPATEPAPHTHEPSPEPTAEPEQVVEPDPTSEPDPEPTSEPEPEPTSEPEPEPEPEEAGSGPTAAQWEALRQCESGGNYQILSPGGTYRGAYQFSQATWDSTAAGAWPRLVGVDPAEASVRQQDKMAQRLYDLRGAGPWPVCGRHLS